MRLTSRPSRRAAYPRFISAQLPAEPEPGTLRHVIQIIRSMPLDEIMCGVTFVCGMYVLLMLLVLFS